MKVGFVGLGQMGAPMACNLSKKFETLVYDRDVTNAETAIEAGAKLATDLENVASANLILLCLPNGAVVEQVLFGAEGLAQFLKPGVIVVDTSTIEYGTTLSVAERLSQQQVHFIDAPVSGMRARAVEGTLTMMCGGEESLLDDILPVLETMASNVLFMGKTGSGQLTKLINQLLFDINAAALAEILPLAVKLGLNAEKVGSVVNSGTGRSYASEFFIPNMLKGDFSQGYPLAHAYKDLISGAEISARHQIPTPVLSAATATYQMALLAGHGASDKAAMLRVYEDMLDVQYRAK